MKTIHKFELVSPINTLTNYIETHAGAKVRHVAIVTKLDPSETSPRKVNIWAEVDTSRPIVREALKIKAFATGQEIPQKDVEFLATVIDGSDVWHIYQSVI